MSPSTLQADQRAAPSPPHPRPPAGKRQHHRKTVPYRWMIVGALTALPGNCGTAPQIFELIESNPSFSDQLDVRIMPGTKHVPRCVADTAGAGGGRRGRMSVSVLGQGEGGGRSPH